MSYTLQIDEEQRHYIEKALKFFQASHPLHGDESDSLLFLSDMLEEIPKLDDAETTVHGLCL